ncbi:MAG: tetratricopeptide repeat protein, partial [Pleurocapsa sp. MO_226.B13]|nr:tetratricopeptide repeat protein [Pleurocapsa sp. MO_226.B13]
MVSEDWQGINIKGEGKTTIRDNIFNFPSSFPPAALGRIIDQSRPPLNNWQGRVEELKLLQDWTQRSHEIQVIGLIAAGGYGKSALAAKFCETVKGFTQVIWSTFSKMYSFAIWGRWLLEQIGVQIDEKVSDEDLVILVSDRLAKNRYLVVMDNLETLIDQGGQWKDHAYRQFLVRWTGTTSPSVVLITSREQPSLPDNALNRSIWQPLGGLSQREGADLLQALQVQGEISELESFVDRIDGHPLLIDLSVGVLKKIAGNQPSINEFERANLNLLEIVGQHRGNPEISVAKILTASLERLPSHLQDLLLNLSIYRLPFDWQAAQFMVAEEIETTEASIIEDLRNLSRLAWLIEERSDGIWIFRFQPLVQNYLQEQLEELTKAHERAIDYYGSITKSTGWVLEDVTPELEIFYHYCGLKQYRQANQILDNISTFLSWRGYYLTSLELHSQLITNWQSIIEEQDIYDLAWAWLRVGNSQRSLAEYQKASNSYQKAQNLFKEINDRRGEAVSLGNLGNAYNSLGQYQQAIELYQQSLEIKRQIGD